MAAPPDGNTATDRSVAEQVGVGAGEVGEDLASVSRRTPQSWSRLAHLPQKHPVPEWFLNTLERIGREKGHQR